MTIYENQKYGIYFGDDSKRVKLNYKDLKKNLEESLPDIHTTFNTQNLVFLNQVHGTSGIIVSNDYEFSCPIDVPTIHGDIILTDRSGIGVGILTADCMPIIFYDRKKHALAIAHAGWRGSVAGISQRAVDMMGERFGSIPADIEVHFGPAARPCCYEVKDNFIDYSSNTDHQHFVVDRDNKLFFDNAALNKHLLVEAGVEQDKIFLDHHNCTICNPNYCSYRRDNSIDRQVTVAILK